MREAVPKLELTLQYKEAASNLGCNRSTTSLSVLPSVTPSPTHLALLEASPSVHEPFA